MWIEVNSWSALKYQLLVWKLFGMLPPAQGSSWRIPYLIFGVFINITTTLLLTLSSFMAACISKNISELSDSIYVTCGMAACFFKFLNSYMYRKDLLSVEPILKKLDSRISNAKESKIIGTATQAAHSFFLLMCKIFLSIIISSSLAVYFEYERTLVLPGWFPWDWKSSGITWIFTNCFQVCISSISIIQDAANNACPQAYLYIATAHINVLELRVLDLGKAHDIEANNFAEEKRIYKELQECIKDHLTILQFMGTINQALSNHCLLQFAATGLQLCFIAFYILLVDMDNFSKLLQLFFCGCIVIIEMFILCYCGEKYSTGCQKLSRAIYDCNWIGQNRHFQKALLIFLHRSQCSDVLMAGNLVPVNYPTFVSVMKTSYSFLTVLTNVKTETETEALV